MPIKSTGRASLDDRERARLERAYREHTRQELLFDLDGLLYNALDDIRVWSAPEMAQQQTSKVGMHSLVAAYELIGKGETRHKTTLLQPEYGCKGAREEDPFDGSKGNETFGKRGVPVGYPLESPIGLVPDTRDGLYSVKKIVALGGILDVRINEE